MISQLGMLNFVECVRRDAKDGVRMRARFTIAFYMGLQHQFEMKYLLGNYPHGIIPLKKFERVFRLELLKTLRDFRVDPLCYYPLYITGVGGYYYFFARDERHVLKCNWASKKVKAKIMIEVYDV